MSGWNMFYSILSKSDQCLKWVRVPVSFVFAVAVAVEVGFYLLMAFPWWKCCSRGAILEQELISLADVLQQPDLYDLEVEQEWFKPA